MFIKRRVLGLTALLAMTAVNASKKTLFQRMTRALGVLDDASAQAQAATASVAQQAAAGLDDSPELDEETANLWNIDRHWDVLDKVLDSKDFLSGFDTLLSEAAGAKELWSEPEALRVVLDKMPMFNAIKGIDLIAGKDTLTAEDVSVGGPISYLLA